MAQDDSIFGILSRENTTQRLLIKAGQETDDTIDIYSDPSEGDQLLKTTSVEIRDGAEINKYTYN